MKVRCTANSPAEIVDERLRNHLFETVRVDRLDLEIGAEYIVFGVVFWSGVPHYYVLEFDSDDYPVPVCAAFFEVVCPRLSASWRLVWDCKRQNAEILPAEWAQDESFYERLIDGNAAASKRFSQIRVEIESEANSR